MAEFTHTTINSVDVDDTAVIEYVVATFNPGDVFPDDELRDWAINNGFIEEE